MEFIYSFITLSNENEEIFFGINDDGIDAEIESNLEKKIWNLKWSHKNRCSAYSILIFVGIKLKRI